MNLNDLANIGDFLGGIGVVVSLLYLAIQIRQNTSAQRSNSRLGTTRTMTDWFSIVMSDGELVRIFNDGFLDTDSLSSADRSRFIWMIAALTSRMDEMFSQYKVGLIDEELWTEYRGTMASFLENQVIKEWWDSGVAVFDRDFRVEIETTASDKLTWSGDRLRVLTGDIE